MRKRFITAILTLALLLLVSVPALAVVSQSPEYYVADYAGVLSDTLEQKIISSDVDLEQKCDGAQIVVVTVDYLDGMLSDEYALQLFNDWESAAPPLKTACCCFWPSVRTRRG